MNRKANGGNLFGEILNNVSLARYTTIKIGGIAKNLYFPQKMNQLEILLRKYPQAKILGGGSNLLINDKKVFEHVICLRKFENNIKYDETGIVTVGSGVRLQKLISDINLHGKGGIEYLFSVPGLVGGAIFMNAGRGAMYNKQISDYLLSVDYLQDGKLKSAAKDECDFSYRCSMFQSMDAVIVSAKFRFDEITPEEGKKRCSERIALVKENQDNRYPNAGTTFCEYDPRIMKFFRMFASKDKEGMHFSPKSLNWLQNRGNGTFEETKKLLNKVKRVHKFFGKKCKIEYIIWD